MPPLKAGFQLSALDVKKTRFYSSAVRISKMGWGDLVDKISGVTGAEHKHNKLVIMTS